MTGILEIMDADPNPEAKRMRIRITDVGKSRLVFRLEAANGGHDNKLVMAVLDTYLNY